MKKLLFFLFPGLVSAQFTNELFIPPVLTGSTFELTIDESTRQFYPGQTTETIGFNGDFLGPTLIFNQGEADVKLISEGIESSELGQEVYMK